MPLYVDEIDSKGILASNQAKINKFLCIMITINNYYFYEFHIVWYVCMYVYCMLYTVCMVPIWLLICIQTCKERKERDIYWEREVRHSFLVNAFRSYNKIRSYDMIWYEFKMNVNIWVYENFNFISKINTNSWVS